MPSANMMLRWQGPEAGNTKIMAKTKERSKPVRILRRIIALAIVLVLIFVLGTIGISAFTILSTRDNVHTIAQIEERDMHADAIVVLGASVFANGTPSDILADRLEVASDLYFEGAAPVIIASGDNTTVHYNESDAMKAYCEKLGVPTDAIYVDHAGYDTYASIYRAKYVYGASSIMVVTQAYHLYRSLMIAEMLGMQAEGVAADKGKYDGQFNYSIRELMARDKDFLQSLLKIPPKDATQPIEN